MPTTFLNTQQALELADAIDHAVELVKKQKKDASVLSLSTDTWIATPTEVTEYFDQTLVRVCFNEADVSNQKHPWGMAYKNSVTGETVISTKKQKK
tara:strand:+ start:5604 stop:5891 length:288 start_codon:yes stop_codon:yes gene_type:complete